MMVNLILLVMFLSSDFQIYLYFLDIDWALKANNIYIYIYFVFCLTVHRWKTIACAGCVSGSRGHCAGSSRLGTTIVCVCVCVCVYVCVCVSAGPDQVRKGGWGEGFENVAGVLGLPR